MNEQFYFTPVTGMKYCNQHVCKHTANSKTRCLKVNIFLVACGSVLLWQRCDYVLIVSWTLSCLYMTQKDISIREFQNHLSKVRDTSDFSHC